MCARCLRIALSYLIIQVLRHRTGAFLFRPDFLLCAPKYNTTIS